MTDRNDMNNYLVIALGNGGDHDTIIGHDQAENIARQEAEKYASANHGITVCVYQRVGAVKTVPTAKWE